MSSNRAPHAATRSNSYGSRGPGLPKPSLTDAQGQIGGVKSPPAPAVKQEADLMTNTGHGYMSEHIPGASRGFKKY